MPRGRANPKVRDAEARVAQGDVAVMSAIADRVACGAKTAIPEPEPKLDEATISQLSADEACDELDRCFRSTLSETDKELCIACLERCDTIWSDDDVWDHAVDDFPNVRAVLLAGIAMWLTCERGDIGTHKVDRKMFVYACMLLPSVLGFIAYQQNEDGVEVGACDEIAAAEVELRKRTGHASISLMRLLTAGLAKLNAMPDANVNVVVPVLAALAGVASACVQTHDHPRRIATNAPIMTPGRRALAAPRAIELFESGALAEAIATAATHTAAHEVYRDLIRILTLLAPSDDMEDAQARCDALVSAGALPPALHAMRTFAEQDRLVEQAVDVLDKLTCTEQGRRAARECNAAGAIDALIGIIEGGASVHLHVSIDELKVLRAVVVSEDITGIMSELAPGLLQGVSEEAQSVAEDNEADLRCPCVGYKYGPSGDTAWYWY